MCTGAQVLPQPWCRRRTWWRRHRGALIILPCQGRWVFPERTAAHREPTGKQVYPEGLQSVENNPGAGESCEEEGIAERTVILSPCLCS